MKLLEEKIRACGKVYPGDVLKVDSFVNHQIDTSLAWEMAEEFHRLFADAGVTKVLTIEASGIAVACMTAYRFGVPMVFAKKSKTSNMSSDVYSTEVRSYTHNTTYNVTVAREYLKPDDNILLIDDFLARGEALRGLLDLSLQSGASVAGMGVIIEKAFQSGGDKLRAKGYRVEALARVGKMDPETGIEFVH